MKILLFKNLYYLDHVSLELVRPPSGGQEISSAGNEVRKQEGETLDVDRDEDSEAAEPVEGSSWFILRETGNRFSIPNAHFRVVEQYLSIERVWFKPSADIQALDNKRLVIHDGESESPASLHIYGADPNGPNAGKVCVKVLSIVPQETEWTNKGLGQPPKTTITSPPWERFLMQDSLNLLRPDEDGMLSLTLPE